MEDDLGRDPEVQGRRVRPGDRHHLFGRIAAEICRCPLALTGRLDGEMTGFVQQVTRMLQRRRVEDEDAAVDGDARKERVSIDGTRLNLQTDLAQKRDDGRRYIIAHGA